MPAIIGAMTTSRTPPDPTPPAKPGKTARGTSSPVNWDAIEREYRSGIPSVREIEGKFGVSHTAVNKRADKDGWTRDLKAKIQAKAEAEVSRRAVAKDVSKVSKIAEKQIVEANAEVIVQVRLAHRKDIARSRAIVMALLAELEATCGVENAALVQQLGKMVEEGHTDSLNELFKKIVSLPGRAKTMRDLGESLRVTIALEREAFALEDAAKQKDGDALANLLHGIASGVSSAFKPVAIDPEHDGN